MFSCESLFEANFCHLIFLQVSEIETTFGVDASAAAAAPVAVAAAPGAAAPAAGKCLCVSLSQLLVSV